MASYLPGTSPGFLMHTYNPRIDQISPCFQTGMSTRERLYVRVRKTYEMGHFDYAQALFHLLEDGLPTNVISLWWNKTVDENPQIVTQMTTGQSVYAISG